MSEPIVVHTRLDQPTTIAALGAYQRRASNRFFLFLILGFIALMCVRWATHREELTKASMVVPAAIVLFIFIP